MENSNMSLSQKSKNVTRAHPYAQTQRQKSIQQQTSVNGAIGNALTKKSTNQTSNIKPTNKGQSIISNYDLNSPYSYEDYSSKWDSASIRNVSSFTKQTTNSSSNFIFSVFLLSFINALFKLYFIYSKN